MPFGVAREQGPPVADELVEQRRRCTGILRQRLRQAGAAGDVGEPLPPERASVPERGVEVDRDGSQRASLR